MSKINKVLYNVNQRDSSKGTVNTREEMWMARNNIGLDEVIGHATVTENDKEYKGIAPLGTNGLVPAEFLPSFVDSLDATKTYSGTNFSVTVTETDGLITSVTGTDNTAANNHDHGSITNNGKVSVAGTTKKTLLITDNDDFVKTGPSFGNETGDSKLFLNKNGEWTNISVRDPVFKYSGSSSLNDDEYNTMVDAIGSDELATIMYGSGSGSSYWHLLKVDSGGYTFDYINSEGNWCNMDVGSDKTVSISTKGYLAPVINPSTNGKVLVASHDGTIASTKWETNFAVPTFGKYDLATSPGGSLYINTNVLPSSYVSSYLCSYASTLSTTDTNGTTILCVPPHHRGSAHCIISGGSLDGDVSQGNTSWIRFYLTDMMDPTTEPDNFTASALWHGYGIWLGSSNMDYKHASFIYRNDGDQSKYITCFIGSSSPPASFTIHKEFEMFPTE